MKEEKNICVYLHRRLDNNEVFYIGIGNSKRPYSKEIRNNFWLKIINKSKYSVEIIYNNLNKFEALQIEIFLIKLYGRRNLNLGTLTNLTDGGEGGNGIKLTEQQKQSSGIYLKGDQSRRKRKVYQFCKNGKFIKEWNCIKTAELFYNKNKNAKNIVACCNNKQCTAYGYIWKHSKESKNKIPIIFKKGKLLLDLNTGIFYNSIVEAAIAKQINISTLKNYLKFNNKSNIIYV